MAKRIFEIAKELGVKSKAIREKCIAEGIPADKVKNHMASISPGLEASIREWFTVSSETESTAVQTSAQVDLDKVRAKPKRKTAGDDGADETDHAEDHGGATAVATPPAPTPAVVVTPSTPDPEPTPEPVSVATPEADAPADDQAAVASEPVAEAPAALEPASPEAASEPPATTATAPAAPAETPAPTTVRPPAPTAPVQSDPPATGSSETPDRPGDSRQAAASDDASTAPGTSEGGSEEGGSSVRAAPQNVPDRPKVIAPAGPKLQTRTPVKMSGPKVVRVEAPEPMETRRPPRRDGPGPGHGGGNRGPSRGGGGAGPPDMPPMDDRGRSPRRQQRKPGGGGAGGGHDQRGGARRGGGGNNSNNNNSNNNRGKEGLGTGIFREQDLLEREARLERSSGFMKQRRREQRRQKTTGDRPMIGGATDGVIRVNAPLSIKDLSAATGVKAGEIMKRLFQQGVVATINSSIEGDKAAEIMLDFDLELEVTQAKTAEEAVSDAFESRESIDVQARSPVVTILGHVDHGKTSLLDKIRKANVAAGEAGGITQATSAFRVPLKIGDDDKQVVFLDTPGHQAFTEMRSRGANMTDIIVLVVAADDGVMPQTIESIAHAKAADVPIIVALNKCDRPEATDSKMQEIFGQLAEHGLNPVPWGGDVEVVRTSAIEGTGIDELLEVIDLQGQVLELTAGYGGPGRGTVIESQVLPGRGATANILVQEGSVNVGDFIVVGRAFGRVRDIVDDRSKRLKEAGPSMPVQISGLDEVPSAGDRFYIVDSLKKAQESAEHRRDRERKEELAKPKMTLDSMFSQMAEAEIKEVRVVLKADVQGSLDVLKNEIEKIATEEVRTRVLHAAVGGVSDSDVLLAQASEAIIIGFNVIASSSARSLAEQKSVEIRNYQVIYHITDDLKKAAEGLLTPELRQEVLGHAEVRAVFKISKVGSIAGCYITDGVVERDALIRVTRDDVVIENDRVLEQLKRVKDDVKEVRSNTECGMKIVGYDDIKEGDVLECYKNVEVKRTL